MNEYLVAMVIILVLLWIGEIITERYHYKIEMEKIKRQREKESSTDLRVL